MSSANDTDEANDEPPTYALALTMAGIFFAGGYFSSTVVHEVLGRRGLPTTPVIYAVAFLPVTFSVVRYEERIQQTRHWPTIEKFWYAGIVSAGMVAPAIATAVFPQALGRSMPRGTPTALALAVSVGAPVLALARGLALRKRAGNRR